MAARVLPWLVVVVVMAIAGHAAARCAARDERTLAANFAPANASHTLYQMESTLAQGFRVGPSSSGLRIISLTSSFFAELNGSRPTRLEVWTDAVDGASGARQGVRRPGLPIAGATFDVSSVTVHIGEQAKNVTIAATSEDGILLEPDRYYWLVATFPGGLGWTVIEKRAASDPAMPIVITDALAGKGASGWQMEQNRSAVLGFSGCFEEADGGISPGAVAGIVVGIVIGVMLLTGGFVAFLAWVRRRRYISLYEAVNLHDGAEEEQFSL